LEKEMNPRNPRQYVVGVKTDSGVFLARWKSRRGISHILWGCGEWVEVLDKTPAIVAFLDFKSLYFTMSAPKGPFHLVTVNTAPERAKRLIGRVAEALSDRYTIIHVDNCESEHCALYL
jgi:hypothetical protein